jgi:hypothetical protein
MELLAKETRELINNNRIKNAISQNCGYDSHLTAAMIERFGDARDIAELREALRSLEQEIHQGYAAALASFSSK